MLSWFRVPIGPAQKKVPDTFSAHLTPFLSLNTPRMFFLFSLLLLVTGCGTTFTPQIRLESADQKMEVKSKVAGVAVFNYSPDGKSLVSGGVGSSLRLWDLQNAKGTRAIPLPGQYGTFSVAYSPDGKFLAASGRTGIHSGDITRLYEAATGVELKAINGNFGRRLSFSPDGKYLLGSTFSFSIMSVTVTTKLADVHTGEVVRTFDGFEFGAISPDGRYAALAGEGLTLFELQSGRKIWRNNISSTNGNIDAVTFTPDGRHVLASRSAFHGTLGSQGTISVILLDAATGNQVRELIHFGVESTFFGHEKDNQKLKSLIVSPDGKLLLGGNTRGEHKLWDLASGGLIRQLKQPGEKVMLDMGPAHAAFSPNGKIVTIVSAASLRIFNVASGNEVAAMIAFDDGEWLITTPNGYYNSSEKGDQYLDVSVAGKPFSTSQLRESFFRPDLVKVALSGGSLNEYRKIEDIKQPPAIAIIDTPTSVTKEQVTVSLEVKDQGGGIGDVRLYLNGSAVVLDRTRNLAVAAVQGKAQVFSYKVRLVAGKNSVRAIAFNAGNSMQSTDALHEIEASIAAKRPSLHALIIGIQDYDNPKLTLKYPVADAKLMAATLRERAPGLFEGVNVVELTTKAQTTKGAITKTLKEMSEKVRPDDLFVFFVASHGTVDDGEYFLITSNVGATSTHLLKQTALSQDDLKALIANVPATKKLVLIDTCNAGKLGEAIQVAMLTRGMNEDTALKILSRAVGSTILSASNSVQEALEGYKNHGLFTYVVAEGLKGAADSDRDGYVKTHELVNYVDSQVPELAEQVFKHKQYPTTSLSGQGFPVVRVK